MHKQSERERDREPLKIELRRSTSQPPQSTITALVTAGGEGVALVVGGG